MAGQRIARGADGAGLLRQAYRRSPLRTLVKVAWPHRGLRQTDVLLAGYPRSGSAWTRFMILEMLTGDASFRRIVSDVPYVGAHHASPALLPEGARLIKTHEKFVARYRRAIHLVRDPRDVVVSYFHFLCRNQAIRLDPDADRAASFDRFVDAFLAGRVDAHGTWQEHTLSWYEAALDGHADILRVRYEDLLSDTPTALLRVARWLGVPLSVTEAARVAASCSVEAMQAAEAKEWAEPKPVFPARAMRSATRLVRQGRAGGWRDELTEEQQGRFAAFSESLSIVGYPEP